MTFGLIHEVYRGIYPALESTPFLALARLVLAVIALAPATIMMGATFPALVRHFSRTATLGVAFGRLYSANTLGAVAGTLVAGLVLIEVLGLSGALRVGAAFSAIAGLVALWLARPSRARGRHRRRHRRSASPEPAAPTRIRTSACHHGSYGSRWSSPSYRA